MLLLMLLRRHWVAPGLLFKVSSPPGLQQAVKVTTKVDLAAGSSPGNSYLSSSSYSSYRVRGSN